jgi:hypothetical protein
MWKWLLGLCVRTKDPKKHLIRFKVFSLWFKSKDWKTHERTALPHGQHLIFLVDKCSHCSLWVQNIHWNQSVVFKTLLEPEIKVAGKAEVEKDPMLTYLWVRGQTDTHHRARRGGGSRSL